MNFGHQLSELVDGRTEAGNGLDMERGKFERQTIVFATNGPVSAQIFQITTWHLSEEEGAYPAQLQFSVTVDPQPHLGSRWEVLKPTTAMSAEFAIYKGCVSIDDTRILISPGLRSVILAMRANAPLKGITGFRLEFIPTDGVHPSGQPVIGRSQGGNCVLNEFQVELDPLRTSNIALGRPVDASGPTYPGLPPLYLTDGFAATFSHPAEGRPAGNFHFDIDLGASTPLDHLVISGRLDGKSPERLSRFEIQTLDDDGHGEPGAILWRAPLHQDGSYPPLGSREIIRARDGSGARFAGRFIRILNSAPLTSTPQVAELEAYPELHPTLASIRADQRLLDQPDDDTLPAGTREVSFTLQPGAGDPVPELLAFRLRFPDRDPQWRECRAGEPILLPCAETGIHRVEFQARHTDGQWSEVIQSHRFFNPPPWWRRPLVAGSCLLGFGLIGTGMAWAFSVRRLRRQVARARTARSLERDRLRIARDMHDDIGARLTHLALLADRAHATSAAAGDLLPRLAGHARSTVAALDQIVWAVNPRHDTLGSFIDYVCHFATEYFAAAGLVCRFEMKPHDRGAVVPFSIRHPLLMAVKETLQNIVKHAEAHRVTLAIHSTATGIGIAITDDGRGLDPVKTASPHQDGLANMKARLAELKGACTIESPASGGTRVLLTVPL